MVPFNSSILPSTEILSFLRQCCNHIKAFPQKNDKKFCCVTFSDNETSLNGPYSDMSMLKEYLKIVWDGDSETKQVEDKALAMYERMDQESLLFIVVYMKNGHYQRTVATMKM